MTSIVRADSKHAQLISQIAAVTFIESHGKSANLLDIQHYVAQKYGAVVIENELNEKQNIYSIIYYKGTPVGYSKVIFNTSYEDGGGKQLAKLERLYILKEFYDLKLGSKLFQFNLDLAKVNSQHGIWLFVWKQNHRAINFYRKKGFLIVGSRDFPISATHTNPNHLMFLRL